MKLLKSLVLILVALLLTGCYTQLQYSQKMKKITDRKEVREYSRSDGERESAEYYGKESDYYAYEDEDYVPVYYKDYEYQRMWDECGCSPYNVYNYNFYGSYHDYYDYHRPYRYRTYLSISPFHYYRWHYSPYWKHRFYRSSFAFSFSWGSPSFYHSFYWDSFHHPYYYDHYWYGYHSPLAYNYYYFYNSGHHYYGDKDRRYNRNSRYGPRSIGSDRSAVNVNRTRNANRTISGRSGTIQSGKSTVRTRSSVGTSRTRGTTGRNTGSSVGQSRSRGNGSGTVKERSRGNLQRSDADARNPNRIRVRSVNPREQLDRQRISRSSFENRLRSLRLPDVERRQQVQNRRPTFLNRLRGFFENNSSRLFNGNRSSGTSVGTRFKSSSNSRPNIRSRSSSTNSRSTVTRSKSSSGGSKARSRGSSSSSRNRGGGGDSGSSDRSRGN